MQEPIQQMIQVPVSRAYKHGANYAKENPYTSIGVTIIIAVASYLVKKMWCYYKNRAWIRRIKSCNDKQIKLLRLLYAARGPKLVNQDSDSLRLELCNLIIKTDEVPENSTAVEVALNPRVIFVLDRYPELL